MQRKKEADESRRAAILRAIAGAALALVLASCAAHAADDVRIVDRRTIAAPPSRGATHTFALHVYAFAGTSWRSEEVAAAIPRAAALLAQCAIALERVEVAVLEAPRRFRYYYTPDSRDLMRRLDAPRPAVFFVEDARNEPAYDAEAIGLANSPRRPELANTVWIAYGARELAHAIAHELVHVLADSGEHSSEPDNLMRDETSPTNTRLTPVQCARARSRGEANGLLARTR
jgi:hypothetical protein